MLRRISISASLCVLFAIGSTGRSQDKPAEQSMPDVQEMMKKWLATITPGPQHKKLDFFVGNWESTTKIWLAGPDAPPVETKGASTMKWILDGRFVQHESDGEMLLPDAATGQMKPGKHRGLGLTGFDIYRGMFIGIWADNLSTTILTFAGTADPTGKVFTYYGEMDEPMLDIRARTVKYVTRIIDDNHFVFEIFDLAAGPDYKVFQIDYTRKK